MNRRDAKDMGRSAGMRVAEGAWREVQEGFASHTWDAMLGTAFEIEANSRQYVGHPGYDFNMEPNAESLWDAYEEGVAIGIRKGLKKYFR